MSVRFSAILFPSVILKSFFVSPGFKNQPLKMQRLVLKSSYFRRKLDGRFNFIGGEIYFCYNEL
jgi:hypothetical protein